MLAPPDLQNLVEQFGGFDKITADAWRKHAAELDRWRNQVAAGEERKPRRQSSC
jgi:hypothetical protein